MPLEKCSRDGQSGWKVHNANTCFIGKDAKKRALKQLQAIEINKHSHGKRDFIESMSNALDPELAMLNALAEIDLTDSELDKALDGHGTYKYSCGHIKQCGCQHNNMNFYVQCVCDDCRGEENGKT